ncbi:rhodanese-like domain-containing protein [Micrococcales bacterium 31B]|nr:rhodanese-like domain-containing protein [Micrococcales bacterium 31B]
MSPAAAPVQTPASSLWQDRSAPQPLIVDVREPAEYASAHIPGAHNVPLGLVTSRTADVVAALKAARTRTLVVCHSGARAERAAAALSAQGVTTVETLTGGMVAYQAVGHPVNRGRSAWAMDRQVRLAAGTLVLAGIAASLIAPRAKYFAGAIGAGLTYSALSNTCALAAVLGSLPWNRETDAPSDDDCLASLRNAAAK